MDGLTISKEQQVAYTQKEEGYIISSRDWKRICHFLNKIEEPSNIWLNVGWATLGIGLSCLASWATDLNNSVYLVLWVSCIGVAICSFFAAKQEKSHNKWNMDNLQDVIKEVEDEIVPKNSEKEVSLE